MRADEILALARAELGVKEFPPSSNNVKYNTEYYGREVSGRNLNWCCVFLWWLFQKADAPGLFFDGRKTAYVPTLVDWARRHGRLVERPQPGDLVCFDFNGNGVADHIGLCEDFDGAWITTIDGNTGTTSESNGGSVMRRRREKKYIVTVIRPGYTEEDEFMDAAQFDKMMEKWLERRREAEPSASWGGEARAWAIETGLIAGDEHGRPQWEGLVTRNQLVTILHKFWKMLKR